MIKIHVTYICDACGKKEGMHHVISGTYSTKVDNNRPLGWSVILRENIDGTPERLLCPKCTREDNKFESTDETIVGDRYPL